MLAKGVGMGMETVASRARCPVCASDLTSDPHYVRWCRACGWNADPSAEAPPSRLRRALERRADRATRQLFDSVRAHAPSERRGALVSVVVYLAAMAVHAVTATVVVAVPLILVLPGRVPTWLRIICAALVLGIALFVVPFNRVRTTSRLELRRADAPTLFGLIDEVARETGAPAIDSVSISADFNASYSARGVRRQRQLGIGMALWSVLDAQERLALITHELGHAVNGDLRNTVVVHRALVTLSRWRQLFTPTPRDRWESAGHHSPAEGLVGLVEAVVLPVVLFPFAALTGAFSAALDVIANRDGQRREYYADELAARVAGSTAAIQLTEMLLLADFCQECLVRTARFHRDLDPWQTLRGAVLGVPPTELERLRWNARQTLGRIDSTHPPTQLRADLLRGRPAREPRIVVSAATAETIERELHAAKKHSIDELRYALGT